MYPELTTDQLAFTTALAGFLEVEIRLPALAPGLGPLDLKAAFLKVRVLRRWQGGGTCDCLVE